MRQTILSILLVVVLAATGYVWFRYIRQPQAETSSDQTSSEESDRLNQYRRLKNFKPDTSILSDPLFQSLTGSRFSSASSSAPVSGRLNPFSPF